VSLPRRARPAPPTRAAPRRQVLTALLAAVAAARAFSFCWAELPNIVRAARNDRRARRAGAGAAEAAGGGDAGRGERGAPAADAGLDESLGRDDLFAPTRRAAAAAAAAAAGDAGEGADEVGDGPGEARATGEAGDAGEAGVEGAPGGDGPEGAGARSRKAPRAEKLQGPPGRSPWSFWLQRVRGQVCAAPARAPAAPPARARA
jgi:hypothetical protein